MTRSDKALPTTACIAAEKLGFKNMAELKNKKNLHKITLTFSIMKILLITALSLILTHDLSSQMVASFEKGMIVKKNGDSINCFVPISIYYSKTVKYRMGKNTPDISINTNEIKYLITPFNRFENILIENKEYMMRSVVNGKVTLLSQNIPDEGKNPNGGTYMYSAPIIIYALNIDSSYYLMEKKNFKKVLSEHLYDCPEILTKIENKSFQYDDMENVINAYNSCK